VIETIEMVVTVKAYPSISQKHGEAVCVAGVRVDGDRREWVRLYPVQFRDLDFAMRFSKYQYLTLDVTDASDGRPESRKPIIDSIRPGAVIGTKNGWAARREVVEPLMLESMCELREKRKADGTSLGVFRPALVEDLTWEEIGDEWDQEQQGVADQPTLFFPTKSGLERIPFRFRYEYRCADADCPSHKQTIVDWEIAQLYRTLRDRGDVEDVVLRKIRDKWLGQMCSPERDMAFFVGNQFRNPDGFLVLGVFWPPRI